MAPNEHDYDTALVWQAGYLAMRFPAALSRSMSARHYNRARLTITDQGILLRPYQDTTTRTVDAPELPDWSEA